MDKQKAIEILSELKSGCLHNGAMIDYSPPFEKWRSNSIVAIKKIFGENSHRVKEFENIDKLPFVENYNDDDECG